MRSALLGLFYLSFSLVPAASAGIIPLVYQGNIIEGLVGDQGLPYLLSGSPNNLRLRYFMPGYANLISINSISVTVDVYDDGDSNKN